jgi:hypothetical protein
MSKDDEGIYKVDTVPPPAGEDDAYSAPTRIGVMASAIVGELLAQGEREVEAPKDEAKTVPPPAPVPADLAKVVVEEEEDDAEHGEIVSPLKTPAPPPEAAPVVEQSAAPKEAEAPASNLPLVLVGLAIAALLVYLLAR